MLGFGYVEYSLMACSIYNLVNVTIAHYFEIVKPTSKITAAWKSCPLTVLLWPWLIGFGFHCFLTIPNNTVIDGTCFIIFKWYSLAFEQVT